MQNYCAELAETYYLCWVLVSSKVLEQSILFKYWFVLFAQNCQVIQNPVKRLR